MPSSTSLTCSLQSGWPAIRSPRAPAPRAAQGSASQAAFGARIEPGADFLAELTGLDLAIADADVLLSGRGSLRRPVAHRQGRRAAARARGEVRRGRGRDRRSGDGDAPTCGRHPSSTSPARSRPRWPSRCAGCTRRARKPRGRSVNPMPETGIGAGVATKPELAFAHSSTARATSRNSYSSRSSTPGNVPDGSGDRMCACSFALDHALPFQRSCSAGSGRRQHDSSGQVEREPVGRLPAAEPLGVRERHADRDRELLAVGGAGLRRLEERALRGVGVLVELGRAVLPVERGASRPVATHELALGGARGIHRQSQSVVLVGLRDRAVAADPQEVQRDVEVGRREVREAQRSRLVGHAERVAEVLDRDVAVGLRLLQERRPPACAA